MRKESTEKESSSKTLSLDLFGHGQFLKDFKKLYKLTSKTISTIAKIANTEKGFHVDDDDAIKLLKTTSLSADDLGDCLSVARHLFTTIADNEVPINVAVSEIKSFAKKNNFSTSQAKENSIKNLINPGASSKKKNKALMYSTGIVPTLEAISAVHDFRAVFSTVKSQEVDSFVPVLVFNIKVRNSRGEHENLVFQTDKNGLEKLRERITIYEDKLSAIIKKYKSSIPIYIIPK